MADAIGSATGELSQAITGGLAKGTGAGFGTGWIIGIAIFIGVAVLSVVAAFVWWYFYEKKKYNLLTRVHYENPMINGVSFGTGNGIPTKRVRFKDGKVAFIYKSAIQGYTISPELLTLTRPREYDVIVTGDKKLFCVVGFTSIDVKRKQLEVDISYPDIEMDRQDLQKHIDSKKYDDPNERFKMIAKVASLIFVGVVVIVLVVLGSKTYIDSKNIDAGIKSTNLEAAKYQAKTMEQVSTFIAILSKVMPESFKDIDGKILVNQTGELLP